MAKRKIIGKAAPVRCVVDTTNDAAELSLDENISRRGMHPADEFEAFREQAERRGFGAEEIGARFGVTAARSSASDFAWAPSPRPCSTSTARRP